MQAFSWNPKDYAQHSASQQAWARELIAKLGLKGDEHVLDIGCGDGKVTAEIACLAPHGRVVGIDNSAEMIGFARREHVSQHSSQLSFECVDASALPFREEFDVVFSNAALHWIRDHRPVLAGIGRCLRPGGRALLQMGGRGNASDIVAVLDEMMSGPQWRGFFDGFSFPYGFHGVDNYNAWLAEVGLRPLRVELIPKTMHCEGAEGLAAWVRTTWLPYTQLVPENQRGEFVDELVNRYIERRPADGQAKVHVGMVRLEVEASKD